MPTIHINPPIIDPALASSDQVLALKDPVGWRPSSPLGAVNEEAVDPLVTQVAPEAIQDLAHARGTPAAGKDFVATQDAPQGAQNPLKGASTEPPAAAVTVSANQASKQPEVEM